MSDTTVAAFEGSLTDANGTIRRTTAAEFSQALDAAVVEPAVGTPLPFEGVSYNGTSVISDPTVADLESAATGVTPATLGVADYGTIVISSSEGPEGSVSLYPEKHVAVLPASRIVDDMEATFSELGERIRECGDDEILATGPSATADMGELVLGAHGPKVVEVVVISDQ